MALKSFEGTDRYRRKRKSDQICRWRIRGTKNRRSLMTDSKILRSEYSSICNRFKCVSRMRINVENSRSSVARSIQIEIIKAIDITCILRRGRTLGPVMWSRLGYRPALPPKREIVNLILPTSSRFHENIIEHFERNWKIGEQFD